MNKNQLIALVRENTFQTVGCTDPVSIALATSSAYNVIGGNVKKIKVRTDKNLFKNAFSVIIPGTNDSGLELAAALGVTLKNYNKGLLISEDITEDNLEFSRELMKNIEINIEPFYGTDEIYVLAEVTTDKGVGTCKIEKRHDNITLLKKNDEIIFDYAVEAKEKSFLDGLPPDLVLEDLLQLIETIELDEIQFIEEGINYNFATADLGISLKPGLGIGSQLSALIKEGKLENNVINQAKMFAAGAADARMGGIKSTVVGCFGSGNHGITIFIPLKMLADNLKSSKLKLFRSIVLAEILTAYIKKITGIITPHCGDIIATGVGVAGGASYLQGKSVKAIDNSIRLVLANLYGVICDGAKPTCALKIATSVQTALESSFLADNINEFKAQGVVGSDFSETLQNLDFLIKKEGRATDIHMVQLLEQKI